MPQGRDDMTIRAADLQDVPAMATFLRGIVKTEWRDRIAEKGQAYLAHALMPDEIAATMAAGCHYHVSEDGAGLSGVVAMRDNRHLRILFVARRVRGQGVAARLWQAARSASLAAGHRGHFTVSAIAGSEPVYRRFGFVAEGPPTLEDGLERTPMRTRG